MDSKKIIETEGIINELQAQAIEKYKANVVKMGIPEECSIGVPTSAIRSLAKKIGKDSSLAFELWETGYHEARLLAVLLFQSKDMSLSDAEALMGDVISWDLCDHLCKNLLIKLKGYEDLIFRWAADAHTYKKRAAFTLIASAALHDKKLTEERVDAYLKLICENSDDGREHVKKAVSWALREIGKIDFACNEKALLAAYSLKGRGSKAQAWAAKDAIKELENVVKVEGRKRLISTKTQMGNGEA